MKALLRKFLLWLFGTELTAGPTAAFSLPKESVLAWYVADEAEFQPKPVFQGTERQCREWCRLMNWVRRSPYFEIMKPVVKEEGK